jgi:hypothetical protein
MLTHFHKNRLWLAFLGILFLIVAWYMGIAFYQLYRYSHLTAKTELSEITWSIKPLSEEEFVPDAKYAFHVDGKIFHGETTLKKKTFKNKWAAEQSLAELTKEFRVVWYSPSNLNNSSLQKKFPLKECLSSAALWGLFVYFLWLGVYVTKFQI